MASATCCKHSTYTVGRWHRNPERRGIASKCRKGPDGGENKSKCRVQRTIHVAVQPYRMHGHVTPRGLTEIWAFHSQSHSALATFQAASVVIRRPSIVRELTGPNHSANSSLCGRKGWCFSSCYALRVHAWFAHGRAMTSPLVFPPSHHNSARRLLLQHCSRILFSQPSKATGTLIAHLLLAPSTSSFSAAATLLIISRKPLDRDEIASALRNGVRSAWNPSGRHLASATVTQSAIVG